MEFTVTKSDLVQELNLSQGVVERKTTIPILSNVLIEAEKDRVTLTTTDLELGFRSSFAARVKKAGSGTVPAKKLLDYVRLLPEGDVNIKFGENQWASITAGRSKTRIAGMSRESFPELPKMPEAVAQAPIKTVASMIAKTIFSISAEESRFTLNGALFIVKPDQFVMVSTDSHRLALVENPGNPGVVSPYRALLPRKAMQELQKLASEAGVGDLLNFAGDENHLFFEIGDRLLISRRLTGNFPEYERVLPKDLPEKIVLVKEEFRASIERVMQFADERSRAVRVQAVAGEVRVHSNLSDTGESEESIPVNYEGPTVEIGFNGQYLLDFMRAVPETEIQFIFKDGGSAGEFRPHSAEPTYNYRYIVMPMRI